MDRRAREKLIARYKDGCRAVAEALKGATEEEFARKLHYDRPVAASVEAFQAVRRATADILERMTEAEWSREGVHPEHGRYTVERWLEIYGSHAFNHADQITRARAAAGR